MMTAIVMTEKDGAKAEKRYLKRMLVKRTLALTSAVALSLVVLLAVSSALAASKDETEIVSHDVYGRQVLPDGSLGGYAYPIAWDASDEEHPRVTADGTGTPFVVWERDDGDGYDLYGSRWRLDSSHFPVLETDADQRRPAVALGGLGRYLTVWQDDRDGDWDVYARLTELDGSDVVTVAQVTGDQTNPKAAYNPDDDEYLIVWQDDRNGEDNPDIYAQWVSGEGLLVGEHFTVTAEPHRQALPHVAYAEGQGVYLVAWRHYTGASDNYFDAYGQLVSSTGQLVGDPIPISARGGSVDRESPLDIIYNPTSEKFLALWNDLRSGTWDVWGRHVSITGTMDSQIQITDLGNHETQAAGAYSLDGDEYLIVWKHRAMANSPGDIRGRRMTGSGVVTLSETILIATGDTNQQYPDVAYLPDVARYAVVWDDTWTAATHDDICGRLISPDGMLDGYMDPIAWETQDENYPQLAMDGSGTALVFWERDNGASSGYDLYGARLQAAVSTYPIKEAEGNERKPAVDGDGTQGYFTVWQDDRNGDWDVYAYLAEPGGSDTITVAQAIGDQTNPQVAYNPDDDEYLIVWQDYRDGTDNPDIYAQRVSGEGLLVGECFTVTAAPYRQTIPQVAYAEGQGIYLVAWRHYTGVENEYFDAYGQLISGAGQLVDSPLPISARSGSVDRESPTDIVYNTTSNQFLVLWNDLRTSWWNVWGRHVSTTGAMEDPIRITYLDSYHQNQAAGAYDLDRDQYLIAWRYRAASNGPGDIHGRRMTGSGVVTASETILITTGNTDQKFLDAAYLPEIGEYTVVWSGEETQHRVYLPLVLRN